MRLEAREQVPDWLKFSVPISAVIISLIIAAILLVIAGAPPIESFYYLIKGAFGSRNAIAETGARATPLILTGLAAGIAFRAKFWNIGAEGQLYAGAIAVTIVGTGAVSLPSALMIPFLFLMGALAGAVVILPSVMLKHFFKVDEVVTTLLAHPDELNLGGEKRKLTVFFSDIRSFTSISEIHPPESIVSQLK